MVVQLAFMTSYLSLAVAVAVLAAAGNAMEAAEPYSAVHDIHGSAPLVGFSQAVVVKSLPDAAVYNDESYDQRWVYETGYARSLGLLHGNGELKRGTSITSHATDDAKLKAPVITFNTVIQDSGVASAAISKSGLLDAMVFSDEMLAARQSRGIVSVPVPPANELQVHTPLFAKPKAPPAEAAPVAAKKNTQSDGDGFPIWMYILLGMLAASGALGTFAAAKWACSSSGRSTLQAYYYRIANKQPAMSVVDENQKLLDSVHSFEEHAIAYETTLTA